MQTKNSLFISLSILFLSACNSGNDADPSASSNVSSFDGGSGGSTSLTHGANCYDGLTDLNGDGKINVADCRGSDGTNGENGAKGDNGDKGDVGPAGNDGGVKNPSKPLFVVPDLRPQAFGIDDSIVNNTGIPILINGNLQFVSNDNEEPYSFCSAEIQVKWPNDSNWIPVVRVFKDDTVRNIRYPSSFLLAKNASFRIVKTSNNRCANNEILLNPGLWTFNKLN
ncbi:MAG: hypothetical protein COV44_09150 [Deltaproteobacteria bacterium CG11_big_fil_rev_8_21_14_0_20_45_16]|nr:MAG: hypothetical protein COV44_09150 [Deltaproteobacteria bacterium CG11_big_fil_rev_8_21_14_0_20_45_16]